jgi:hypothetical protein
MQRNDGWGQRCRNDNGRLGRDLDEAVMRISLAVTFVLTLASSALAQRGVTVAGAIRDSSTGRPVAGANVEIANDSRRFAVRTDEAGEFYVFDVPAGGYRVLTRRIGYAQQLRALVVGSEMKPLEIMLAPAVQSLREVRVRGEGMGIYGELGATANLKPIAGARVQVAGANEASITDSAGSYFVQVKKPGTYMVRIKANGFGDEMFVVNVDRNQVADGSRLLDASDRSPSIPDGLWKDFDQRLRWRSPINSTLVPGSEVRRAGGGMADAIQRIGSVVARGLRLGASVCVFVNGTPRPGFGLNAIRPEEVTAMEVYGSDREVARYLAKDWPGRAQCSDTGFRAPAGSPTIKYLVIWTK